MNGFEFYQDVKVTVWQRQYFEVEADSWEEAIKIAKRYTHKDVVGDFNISDSEYMYETEEILPPADGKPTIEVYTEGGKFIGNNSFPKIGNKCRWIDPGINDYKEEDRDAMLNRVFEIVGIEGDIISIQSEHSFAEVLACEIVPVQ